jgi:hypothetical protein
MTINENLTPSAKANLLASASQATQLVHAVMDQVSALNIPVTEQLSSEQLAVIAANSPDAPRAIAA